MKKLLVLMLVLTFVTAANATVLTWSVDSVTITLGESAVVQLVADDALAYSTKYVGGSPSTIADITSIVALPAAGEDAVVSESSSQDWWGVEAKDVPDEIEPSITLASGNQYDVTIAGLALGTTSYMGSDYYGADDMLIVTVVVPEPMTIALLGLGGLFLRRKK